MPYTLQYNDRTHVVEARFSGTVDLAELLTELAESHALAERHGTTRFLGDLREAEIRIDLADLYGVPTNYEEMGGERDVRSAVLPPTDEAGRQAIEFLQTVSHNRGWALEVFSDLAAAEAWLTESAT